MTTDPDRRAFDRALNDALKRAAAARRQARQLRTDAGRADRLAAAAGLAEAIKTLEDLRGQTASRLRAVRGCGRSRRAYARAATLAAPASGRRS